VNAGRIFHHAAFALSFVLVLAAESCRNAEKSPVNDASIAAGVRHELIANSELARYPIAVDVVAGRVTLEGRVDRAEQREEAEMMARGVDGVEGVSNRILVASTPAAEPPGVPDPSTSER
jgi:hypothetical protein